MLIFLVYKGKGITDQERNILANQLLILGFLRSSADFLTTGPAPSYTASKKKRRPDDDDDGEDDVVVEKNANLTDDEESSLTDEATGTRGTILITLRNVVPYTLW